MSIHVRRIGTAAVVAAAATLVLAATPADASRPPEPADPTPTHTCPADLDAVARTLRAQGFAAPAAKNFALFITQDCIADA